MKRVIASAVVALGLGVSLSACSSGGAAATHRTAAVKPVSSQAKFLNYACQLNQDLCGDDIANEIKVGQGACTLYESGLSSKEMAGQWVTVANETGTKVTDVEALGVSAILYLCPRSAGG